MSQPPPFHRELSAAQGQPSPSGKWAPALPCPLCCAALSAVEHAQVCSELSRLKHVIKDHYSVLPCLLVLSRLRNTTCFFHLKAIASKRTKAFRKASTACRTCGRRGGCLVFRLETSARKFHQIHEMGHPGQALFLKSPVTSGATSLFEYGRLCFPLDSQNLTGPTDNRLPTGWP